MRTVLRGVRVIDPARRIDLPAHDVLLDGGRLMGIEPHVDLPDAHVVDLTPPRGVRECVFCPAFIDLHTHVRHSQAETVSSAARAAAAGGFGAILSMANTQPPVDTPARVREVTARNAEVPITVIQVAAMTSGLAGRALTDIEGCLEAGAAGISDDGRNAASGDLLEGALRRAARFDRPVLVHPEHEPTIREAGGEAVDIVRYADRPPDIEVKAVSIAIAALERAGAGRLHLQHLSAAASVDLVAAARERGMAVTAEVTPHHLTMSRSDARDDSPLRKVNPPLRDDADRAALADALRRGAIDAVATDHAPHLPEAKAGGFRDAAPGMIGLETALASLLGADVFTDSDLPTLIERLTVGPYGVIGPRADVNVPWLRIGKPATATLFDPAMEWTLAAEDVRSQSRNTPLLGTRLRGRVLLTMAGGAVVYSDQRVSLAEAVHV